MWITVDTVFNAVNLVVRIGLIIFLVKKYVIDRIQTNIMYEKDMLDDLRRQHGQLKKTCTDVEQEMKQQEQLYADLQTKFVIWQQSVARKQEIMQLACAQREQKMHQQFTKKEQYRKQRILIEQELPILMQEARATVQKTFQEDKSLSRSYITNVLHALYE